MLLGAGRRIVVGRGYFTGHPCFVAVERQSRIRINYQILFTGLNCCREFSCGNFRFSNIALIVIGKSVLLSICGYRGSQLFLIIIVIKILTARRIEHFCHLITVVGKGRIRFGNIHSRNYITVFVVVIGLPVLLFVAECACNRNRVDIVKIDEFYTDFIIIVRNDIFARNKLPLIFQIGIDGDVLTAFP